MRFLIAALSAAGLLISANTDAFADKRVAFVVGNGAYKNVPALPNPAVDAKSMARCSATSASRLSRAPTFPATR